MDKRKKNKNKRKGMVFFHSNIDRLIQYEYLYSRIRDLPVYVRRRFREKGIHSFKKIMEYRKKDDYAATILLLRDDNMVFRYDSYNKKLHELFKLPTKKFKEISIIHMDGNSFEFIGITNNAVYRLNIWDYLNDDEYKWYRIV